MKRKLSLMSAIILVASSFIACDQDTVEQAVDIANSQGIEISSDEVNGFISGFEQDSTIVDETTPEGDVDETLDEEETTPEADTPAIIEETPAQEPAIVAQDEPEVIHTPAPTVGGQGEELTLVAVPETAEVEPPVMYDSYTPESTAMPVVGTIIVPADDMVPPSTTFEFEANENVHYNLTLLEGENTSIDKVTVSMQMYQPLPEGFVPPTNGTYVSSPTVTKEISSAGDVTTFSVEDWRTTGRTGYETEIKLNFSRPFTVTTDKVGRIPSVNGVVTLLLSDLLIEDNGGEVDIILTLNDETGMW